MSHNPLQENKMGVMPIGKLIINMSLPMMASMLVQALYNIVDSIFVSMISEQALTAVSLAFPAQQLIISLASGTAVGVNALLGTGVVEEFVGVRVQDLPVVGDVVHLGSVGGGDFDVAGQGAVVHQNADDDRGDDGHDADHPCQGLLLVALEAVLLGLTGHGETLLFFVRGIKDKRTFQLNIIIPL